MDPTSGGKGFGTDLHFCLSEQANEAPQQLPELFAVLGTGFPSLPLTTTFKPCRPASLVNPPPHFTLPKQSPAGPQSPPAPHPQPIQQEKHRKQRTSRNRNYY